MQKTLKSVNKSCSATGCTKTNGRFTAGYCNAHYLRIHRHGRESLLETKHDIMQLEDGSCLMNGFIFDRDWAEFFQTVRFSAHMGLYARTGTKEFLHNIIIDLKKDSGLIADHINGNPKDNRRANLRATTYRENNINRPYSASKNIAKIGNIWRARGMDGSRAIELGRFKSREDAVAARLRFLKEKNLRVID